MATTQRTKIDSFRLGFGFYEFYLECYESGKRDVKVYCHTNVVVIINESDVDSFIKELKAMHENDATSGKFELYKKYDISRKYQ